MKKITKIIIATLVAITTIVSSVIAEEHDIINKEQHPDLYCLALNIYFEARSEKVEGQYAVADVTLNRVESLDFPNTICGVVYQTRRRNVCQFSWVCEVENARDPTISETEAWQDAQLYAYEISYWNIHRGITDGATYFHANYAKPSWRHKFEKTIRIGAHLFYKNPNQG